MTDHGNDSADIGAIIMAAGRGSRMKGYAGNKTLLPLIPGDSPFDGTRPILCHLMENLPPGPRTLIVHHCEEDVRAATAGSGALYHRQPVLNGTGGAILAACDFIDAQSCRRFIVTMGDVPFVSRATYARLVAALDDNDLVVLGFSPEDKKQYGVLEIEDGRVRRITEWRYWKEYPADRRDALTVCNSGIYGVTREALTTYLPVLSSRPQVVHKEIDGRMTPIEEYFITDLIEFMVEDGRPVGFLVAESEVETMGVDDRSALEKAQAIYRRQCGAAS
jgi:bifunctional UDP-N-acetylglucosamine pyrophosphorylase/glucosamine-1-phosphate N-acetyltransferase